MIDDEIIYCQICDQNYGDEEYMFGLCHGVKMKYRKMTDKEKEQKYKYEKAKTRVIEQAKKLGW